MSDPYNPTEFRFRDRSEHNRDMLEYQAEREFKRGALELAAAYAQAAGLYAIVALLTERLGGDL